MCFKLYDGKAFQTINCFTSLVRMVITANIGSLPLLEMCEDPTKCVLFRGHSGGLAWWIDLDLSLLLELECKKPPKMCLVVTLKRVSV